MVDLETARSVANSVSPSLPTTLIWGLSGWAAVTGLFICKTMFCCAEANMVCKVP